MATAARTVAAQSPPQAQAAAAAAPFGNGNGGNGNNDGNNGNNKKPFVRTNGDNLPRDKDGCYQDPNVPDFTQPFNHLLRHFYENNIPASEFQRCVPHWYVPMRDAMDSMNNDGQSNIFAAEERLRLAESELAQEKAKEHEADATVQRLNQQVQDLQRKCQELEQDLINAQRELQESRLLADQARRFMDETLAKLEAIQTELELLKAQLTALADDQSQQEQALAKIKTGIFNIQVRLIWFEAEPKSLGH